ncbi:hypothetical protein ABPG74_011088 [Tetrahymena malaccensis]
MKKSLDHSSGSIKHLDASNSSFNQRTVGKSNKYALNHSPPTHDNKSNSFKAADNIFQNATYNNKSSGYLRSSMDEDQINTMKDDSENYSSTLDIKLLQKELSLTKKNLKEAQARANVLTHSNSKLQHQNDILEQQAQKAEKRCKELIEKLSSEQLKVNELNFLNKQIQKELDSLRNDNSETTERMKGNFEILKKKHDDFVEQATIKNTKVLSQIKKCFAVVGQNDRLHQNKKPDFNQEIFQQLRKVFINIQNVLDEKGFEVEDDEVNILQEIKNIAMNKDQENSELKARLQQLQQDFDKEQAHTKDVLPRYRESLEKLKQNSKLMRDKIKELQDSKESEKNEYEKKIKKIQVNYQQSESEKHQLKNELNKLNKIIDEEQKESSSFVKEVGHLRKENGILKKKLEEYKGMVEDQEHIIANLKQEITSVINKQQIDQQKIVNERVPVQGQRSSSHSPVNTRKEKDDLDFYLSKSPSVQEKTRRKKFFEESDEEEFLELDEHLQRKQEQIYEDQNFNPNLRKHQQNYIYQQDERKAQKQFQKDPLLSSEESETPEKVNHQYKQSNRIKSKESIQNFMTFAESGHTSNNNTLTSHKFEDISNGKFLNSQRQNNNNKSRELYSFSQSKQTTGGGGKSEINIRVKKDNYDPYIKVNNSLGNDYSSNYQGDNFDFKSQVSDLANLAACFERVYAIDNYNQNKSLYYYSLDPLINSQKKYLFYDAYSKKNITTDAQTYPLFYNDYGIQGTRSYVIYNQDQEKNLITFRIFFIQYIQNDIKTQESQLQASKILHSYTFYDYQEYYIFYLQREDSTIFVFYFTIIYYSLKSNTIEINRNCNIFYKDLYYCDDKCLYQITFKDSQIQTSQYLCLEFDDDTIESIQYLQLNYLLIFGKEKVFIFRNKLLIEISPRVQYLLIKNSISSEILINLDQITQSQILNQIQFNFGIQMEEDFYMIGLSDQQNYQKTEYLYRLRADQNRNDIQPYLVPQSPYNQSIYTFYQQSSSDLVTNMLIYNFNYENGDILLSFVKINGNYKELIGVNENKISSPFFWDMIVFLIFAIFYLFLIRRRKNKSKVIKQLIEAFIFQSKKEISKKEFFQKYDINFSDPLGTGGFGDVFIANNKYIDIVKNKQILKQMHDKYACKRIIYNKDASFEEQKSSVKNEIEILLKLGRYDHVIKVQNYFIDEDQAIIALELAENNLQAILLKKQENYLYDKFLEKDIVQFLDQIANTIADIYFEERIAHRDLKPENILYNKGIYYLSDFGISQQIGTKSTKENIVFGTIKWMSPELKSLKIKDLQNTQDEIDLFKSDIFSLGLILLYMLTLIDIAQVNQNESLKKSRIRGLKINRSGDVDPLIIQLVSKMLETDPDKRPDPSILKKSIEDIKNMQNNKINKQKNIQV